MRKRVFTILLIIVSYMQYCIGQDNYIKYIEAAKQGDAVAQVEIGNCYFNANGVGRDYEEAIKWWMKAAEKNQPAALYNIGMVYNFGLGVEKNESKAAAWYEKSANQGYVNAQYNLGCLYLYGQGVKQNQSKALYWFKKAGDQNYPIACYNVGMCYYNGWGTEVNPTLAVQWLQKAADLKHPAAYNNLAVCYKRGYGVVKDYEKAAYWYQRAADVGDATALDNLACCYMNGQGVAQDLEKAVKLFEKSLAGGYQPAKEHLEEARVKLREGTTAKDVSKEVTQTAETDKDIPVSEETNKNTFAVIIGNEMYDNEANVPYAENDAKKFSKYVNRTLGVPEKQIKLLTNATLNNMRMAVRWLGQAMDICQGQGQILFYYAGHGIPDEASKASYLLPTDGMGSDVESAYSLQRLYSELGKMPAQQVIVFLDACFSGSKREEGMLASARGVAIKAKPQIPQGKMIVYSAAQEDETAYPYKEKGHGMFTYYLLKKLQETKGEVNLGELGKYLTTEVKRQSFVENSKMQTPSVSVSMQLQDSWRTMKLR